MNEINNFEEIAHSCINIIASDTPDVMLVMCYDADLHKMQLTSAEKKKYLRLFRSSLAIFPSIDLVIFYCSRAK